MTGLPRVGYVRARNLDEVLAALREPGARIYAGGTDLLVALKERRPSVAEVRLLVDIKSVTDARGVTEGAGALRIGALTTANELAIHPLVARHAAALSEAAAGTASPALRHRATVGGNLTTPHPAGDVATALLALDATVEMVSKDGERTEVPVYRLLGRPDSGPTSSLLVAVRVALGANSAYEKMGLRRGFSRARAAVAVSRRQGELRIALAGRAERPRLVPDPAAGGMPLEQPHGALLACALQRIGADS
jgi:CO/xanthine dehydrogenase FAD-binding subunit